MENKINIAELLKDCPKGMELDCTIFNDVTLYRIDTSPENEYPIRIETKNGNFLDLTKYGTYSNVEEAKCVIFPKGKTTWERFQRPFKDGDILISGLNSCECNPFIFKQLNSFGNAECYCAINCYGELIFNSDNWTCIKGCRLATLKEKEKLFNTINEKGYKWNEETKTLEKLIEPKFKVGDRIKYKNGKNIDGVEQGVILSIIDEVYDVAVTNNMGVYVSIAEQDNWELVPNIKPKFKVGDRIKSIISSSYYTVVDIKNDQYFIKSDTEKYPYQVHFSNEINYKLVPNKFDINTLVPFESRVLMRSSNAREWVGTIYSHYNNNYFFGCGMMCQQCIPYEGNEHLLGTTNDCDEYYKTW